MKIAYIVFKFPPSYIGGTEIATLNIAKELSKNHDVHIITKRVEHDEKSSLKFNVHQVGICSKIHAVELISFSLGIILPILKIKPDIIHEQSISPTNIITIFVKIILHVPYVVWARGFDVYMDWHFKKVITKFVLKHAEVMISLSHDMKNKLLKWYKRNIIIIPNGIDLEKFKIKHNKTEIKTKLGIKTNKNIILFVGTLKKVKGIEYLIDAMKHIIQDHPDFLLLIVGNGPNKDNLKAYVNKCGLSNVILFVNEIPNDMIPLYMAISDIFVLPSLSESFGIVNLEAMASGLPIVATEVGGLPEIVKDGENGFLVEPKNPKEIAEKVLMLLKDDELRKRISRANKKEAEKYSWESVVGRLEEVYQSYI